MSWFWWLGEQAITQTKYKLWYRKLQFLSQLRKKNSLDEPYSNLAKLKNQTEQNKIKYLLPQSYTYKLITMF